MDKYLVIELFEDDLDGKRLYRVGDVYPREGLSPTEARIKQLMGLNKYGKTFLQKYTVGTGVGGAPRPLNLETEMAIVRGHFDTVEDRLEADRESIKGWLNNNIMSQAEFDSWVATLLDGGPSIFMDSLAVLQATYPNGASGVALVRETDPARIYVWSGTSWRDFGEYQGLELKDGSVVTEKLAGSSVTPDKMLYIPAPGFQGKNLFNKNDYTPDSIIDITTGVIKANPYPGTDFGVSGFIPVKENTQYIKTGGDTVVYFDANYNAISGELKWTFTTPPHTRYIRYVVPASRLETEQLEEGSELTSYEPYGFYIDTEKIKDKSIPHEKLEKNYAYMDVGKNKFNKDTAIEGMYPSFSLGYLIPQVNYSASEYIPIKPNTTYTKTDSQQLAFYNANKVYISGIASAQTFTTPSDAHFLRVAIPNVLVDIYQVEEGTQRTPYEAYRVHVPRELLPVSLDEDDVINKFEILLPSELYLVTGEEFNIYFRNVLTYTFDAEKYAIRISEKVGSTYQLIGNNLPYKWYYTPTQAGTKTIEVRVIDVYNGVTVVSKELKLNISNKNLTSISTPTIVTIGDSFVDGYGITVNMYNFLKEDPNNQPNFIGLHDSGIPEAKDDAWSGYSYGWYTSNASGYKRNDRDDGTATETPNQFFNPVTQKFDFSYYMNTYQNNQQVDLFLCLLGINDSLLQDTNTMLGALQGKIPKIGEMFDSVLAYDSNIKVLPILITPLNDIENEEFINSFGTWNTATRASRNVEIFNKAMLDNFDTSEWKNKGVHLIAVNANFDYRYGIKMHTIKPVKFDQSIEEVVSSDIHPSGIGSKYIADSMRNGIRFFQ